MMEPHGGQGVRGSSFEVLNCVIWESNRQGRPWGQPILSSVKVRTLFLFFKVRTLDSDLKLVILWWRKNWGERVAGDGELDSAALYIQGLEQSGRIFISNTDIKDPKEHLIWL